MFYLLAFLNIIPLKGIFSSLDSQRKFCFDLVSLFLRCEFEKGLRAVYVVQRKTQASGITQAARKKNKKTSAGLDFRLCGVFPEREHIYFPPWLRRGSS